MTFSFFEQPILNSPYEYPSQHWELDETGQPTTRILDHRRHAKLISPIPKPRRRGKQEQAEFVFDAESRDISKYGQQYDPLRSLAFLFVLRLSTPNRQTYNALGPETPASEARVWTRHRYPIVTKCKYLLARLSSRASRGRAWNASRHCRQAHNRTLEKAGF